MAPRSSTDKLVDESERLRKELLKTAARLEIFAGELMMEAHQLQDEAAHTVEDEGDTDERFGTDSWGGQDDQEP